jgi:hypothetical protein
VHPSSSAAQPASSARKPVPPFSQFRTPGSSASPYVRSQGFGTQQQRHNDDITTSFEDVEIDPPVTLARTSVVNRPDEEIDDQPSPVADLPSAVREESSARYILDEDEDLSYQGWERDHDTPMPKRRKTAKHTEIITVSSSPSDVQSRSPSPVQDAAFSTTAAPQMTSRFRSASTKPHHGATRPAKPSFRVPEPSESTADASVVLPDAFTPSRRKGKRDYIQGGMADTVRSWIFSTAASETQQGSKMKHHVQVASALPDPSARCVSIAELGGKQWLLIRDQNSSTVPDHNDSDKVISNGTVVIRGEGTKWIVPLHAAGLGPDLHVAAVWNVPPGS